MYIKFLLVLVLSGLFIYPALAQAPELNIPTEGDYLLVEKTAVRALFVPYIAEQIPITRAITAYSSTPEETDDTSFITASGERVRDGICASNEFPFGTLLLIDGKIYVVKDRTNARYQYLVDLWMPSKEEAKEWGRQVKEIYLLQ